MNVGKGIVERESETESRPCLRVKIGRRGEGKPRGSGMPAYDVKHGPVIWRKFKALRRGNCVGVSMPRLLYAPAPLPNVLLFSFLFFF